jgi:peptide chain release factor
MNLPDSIMARLAALGVRVEDVEERFIRGSGPGGQKINIK